MVVTTPSTIIIGRPSMPVKAFIIWYSADSSAIIYRNRVARVKKLRYKAVVIPYLCRVHSLLKVSIKNNGTWYCPRIKTHVRTNPSGHFRRMIWPSHAKIMSGAAEVIA